MANLIVSTATEVNIIKAMVPKFIDFTEGWGDNLNVSNVEGGLRFHTTSGNRSATVIGHPITPNYVRITWLDQTHNEFSWDEDITTHSVESLLGVTAAMVRFICDDKWPDFLTRHRKSRPRVSNINDDKPYSTVDVVVLISSSCETMSMYNDFMQQKMSYKQDMSGYMHTIGHIHDRPICISPMIHVIDGVNVLYVEAMSVLIDWEMIEDWVKARVPESATICNSPINALGYIRTAKHKKA